ncbi:MAG: biopolymer transporter ExbD [Candidatus Eiseniibacteriota bacterium]|nr:MAG: biopolymer transporter ExbD [Candidatus Eisenbacteria bacterium]
MAGRRLRIASRIPTASMGDIAMLLLIFFMSTVIFRMEAGLPVRLPRSEAGEKVPRENSARIWIDALGSVSIDDNLISLPDIEPIIADKLSRNPSLIVAFNTDTRCPYSVVSDAMEYLKNANALRVSFTAPKKTGGGKER